MQRFLIWTLSAILLIAIFGCAKKSSDQSAQLAAGKTVFQDNCVRCHGEDGKMIADWRKEVKAKTDEQVKNQIRKGGGGMPAFKDQLTPEQIDQVTVYAKHLASS